MKLDFAIGIDPGVNTGYAIWNTKEKRFESLGSGSILEVMRMLEPYAVFGKNVFFIENPNLRKWYGSNSNSKLQGAGSIKRDYSIWLEWFRYMGAEFVEVAPKNIKTKINQETFRSLTKWAEKTNSHSRDAGMIVFGI